RPAQRSATRFPYTTLFRSYWYSERIGRDMGVVVYGHYGPPMIAFPTTGGDEWEYERQGVIGAMAGAIDAGRVKVFCVNTNHRDRSEEHTSELQSRFDLVCR